MRRFRTAAFLIGIVPALGLVAHDAAANDIKLGGGQKGPPNNMVKLPTIAVAIHTEDGGWKNIKIDAWLAAADSATAIALDSHKTTILAKADRALPNSNFEILQSAEEGSTEAKKVIHAAAEESIGHPWKGDVLIQTMLVY